MFLKRIESKRLHEHSINIVPASAGVQRYVTRLAGRETERLNRKAADAIWHSKQ